MSPRSMRVLGALGVSAALVCSVQTAAKGQTPSRFAGSYQISAVVEDGSQVHLAIQLTVINSSNSDIKGGVVAVLDSQPDNSLIGSFDAIKLLPHLGSTTVIQNFTISLAEYYRWMWGHDPVFQFLVSGPSDSTPVHIQARRVVNPNLDPESRFGSR